MLFKWPLNFYHYSQIRHVFYFSISWVNGYELLTEYLSENGCKYHDGSDILRFRVMLYMLIRQLNSKDMFLDELLFTVKDNNRSVKVIKRIKKRHESCHILPSSKWGNGNVMIWSCLQAGRFWIINLCR